MLVVQTFSEFDKPATKVLVGSQDLGALLKFISGLRHLDLTLPKVPSPLIRRSGL